MANISPSKLLQSLSLVRCSYSLFNQLYKVRRRKHVVGDIELSNLTRQQFLGSVPASICDFVGVCVGVWVCGCVGVCVCGRPIFSSRNDHFQLVAPLN